MIAAGGSQGAFFFPNIAAVSRLRPGEIVVDLFAGGGGASKALEQALGRAIDIAINHDELAIAMHAANHPFTQHLAEDIWRGYPPQLVAGRLVGWLHLSPDCTDHSQAKGGQPRDHEVRALAWAAIKWIGTLAKVGLAPRIFSLENVWQMLRWGRLIAKRCKVTGRVIRVDGSVAAPGEHVPRREQWLVPDKKRLGRTWRRFIAVIRSFGYVVEWRKVRACDFGAGTSRERLFVIGRRDGEPICWPVPTHGPGRAHPYVSAADCIDWSNPGRSIFGRKTPLVRNSILRLLDGATRGNWPQPYIAALEALRDGRVPELDVTAEQAAEIYAALGDRAGMVMAAGAGGVPRPLDQPIPTITAGGQGGSGPQLIRPTITPLLMGTQGSAAAKSVAGQVPTITTGGAANKRPGCARPQMFQPIVTPYYGSGSGKTGKPASDPLPAITTKSRFAVVQPVIISTCNSSSRGVRLGSDPLRTITTAKGGDAAFAEPVIVGFRIDILYRMLNAPELFAAQGFPRNYIIDRTADGRALRVHQSVRMVGNSVSPPPLRAIAVANLDAAPFEQQVAA